MKTRWSRWYPGDRCKSCGFTASRMAEYSYTCPECGVHDGYPTRMAIRFESKRVWGLFWVKTGVTEVKEAS